MNTGNVMSRRVVTTGMNLAGTANERLARIQQRFISLGDRVDSFKDSHNVIGDVAAKANEKMYFVVPTAKTSDIVAEDSINYLA